MLGRFLRHPRLIGRLVVLDFALVLAALLAVVAIGDPGGGRLLADQVPLQGFDGEDRGGGRFVERGEIEARGGTIDSPPGQAPIPIVPEGRAREGGWEAHGGVPSTTNPPAAVRSSDATPGPTSPPRDGSYRQRMTTTSSDGDHEDVTTTHYSTIARSDDETRQTTEGDGPNPFMSPGFSEGGQTLIWRRDGLYFEQSAEQSPMEGGGCEPSEFLLIRLPLEVGTSWKASSRCTFGFGEGFGGWFQSDSSSVVRGAATVVVAGQQVLAWQIEAVTRSTGEFANDGEKTRFEATVESTQYFSPSHGLFVLSHGTYRGSDGSEEQRGTFRTEALNLDPE